MTTTTIARTTITTETAKKPPIYRAAQVGTYMEGFAVVIEPTGSVVPGVYEPVMRLACLDASLAIRPVFERFASVRRLSKGAFVRTGRLGGGVRVEKEGQEQGRVRWGSG